MAGIGTATGYTRVSFSRTKGTVTANTCPSKDARGCVVESVVYEGEYKHHNKVTENTL